MTSNTYFAQLDSKYVPEKKQREADILKEQEKVNIIDAKVELIKRLLNNPNDSNDINHLEEKLNTEALEKSQDCYIKNELIQKISSDLEDVRQQQQQQQQSDNITNKDKKILEIKYSSIKRQLNKLKKEKEIADKHNQYLSTQILVYSIYKNLTTEELNTKLKQLQFQKKKQCNAILPMRIKLSAWLLVVGAFINKRQLKTLQDSVEKGYIYYIDQYSTAELISNKDKFKLRETKCGQYEVVAFAIGNLYNYDDAIEIAKLTQQLKDDNDLLSFDKDRCDSISPAFMIEPINSNDNL